ncbi:MAG: transporter substrate-binding domain-containing protein [Clostridia bacterium]|nr:transporter substrate-binding domain-containing protein [Clostridia bacterium]
MKKIISLILAVVLCFGCAAALASCGGTSNKLVVYTEAGFAPYEFFYNNEIVGVDIKIMEAVAAKLGKELVIEDVAFDSIIGAVKSGKANAGAAGITITAERAEEVDFSIPYSSTEQYVIVKADNTAITNLETLKGNRVGVQQGTTSDFLVSELIEDGSLAGSELTPYDAPAIAAAALGTKIDAVVTDKLTAQVIVDSSNGAYKTFKFTKADGSDVAEVEEYGIAVQKGNAELLAAINEVLEGLIADGSIAKWEKEYNDIYAQIEE